MDRAVFTGTIQAFKRRNPFRPFTVVTVSGSRQEVDFADAIVVRDGVAIFAAVLGLNLLGDGLRQALDPRQPGRTRA